MSLKQISDEVAVVAGLATASVLAIAGLPAEAVVVGAVVAAVIDLPFGSITDFHYHGSLVPKSAMKRRSLPLPKPIMSRYER